MARSYNAETSVTVERLRVVLNYDPETGVFSWAIRTHGKGGVIPVGTEAGLVSADGRRYIGIDGRRYAAHRLAWFYMTGKWPIEVDHKDRNPTNNRWGNLRLATRSQNNFNVGIKRHNTSGRKGVHYDKRRGKWVAQICVASKRKLLGRFDTIDAATNAYKSASRSYFGEFVAA